MNASATKGGEGTKGMGHATRLLVLLPLLALLAGCISDGAAWQIDGKEHSISLVREQKWIWDKRLDLFVVATRMPDCQRRHRLKPATIAGLEVEVFALGDNAFHLRQGGRVYRLETQTCEGFQALDKAPDGAALGTPAGSFRTSGGEFKFVEAPAPKAPAKPAG
jgi:hypothetical protein